jgi:predicted glycoside hydrolase/deacetylase ChbG (UPF0249 family)
MVKMIVRIDDVGFSDVCNIGSFKTIDEGVATSADVMLDSPGTVDALRRLRNYPWISVGWHGHMWGAPVLGSGTVPSMVEKEGAFKGRFREDLFSAGDVVYEEALAELRAQIERCVDILGKAPDVGGGNGGDSPYAKALSKVINEYGIVSNWFAKKGMDSRVAEKINAAKQRGEKWAKHYFPERMMNDTKPAPEWEPRHILVGDGGLAYIDLYTSSIDEQEEKYDPVLYYTEDRAGILKLSDGWTFQQAWHPGYVDYYVARLGEHNKRPRARQFGISRAKDVDALCSPILRNWVKEHNIELVNTRDALYGVREYQNHLKHINSDLYIGGENE